jgi:hypothetical protein
MCKVKQKVSGCFRSSGYAEAYRRISSHLQTMAHRGYNPLVAIQMALSGQIFAQGRELLLSIFFTPQRGTRSLPRPYRRRRACPRYIDCGAALLWEGDAGTRRGAAVLVPRPLPGARRENLQSRRRRLARRICN